MIITISACVVLVSFIVRYSNRVTQDDLDHTILLHQVQRSDFEAFVTEPGDVVSSSNVEVRCMVESRGSPGVAIVNICEEGTYVKEGDLLVKFDDSVLQFELVAQKIVVAKDKAALIQANSDMANAERTLTEYVQGLYQQEEDVLESAVFVAEEELRRQELELASQRRMAARGLMKELQVSAGEFALTKAKKDVDAATRALDVYRKFTREKRVGELEAEIEKQKANVEAATYTLELSRQKMMDIEEQVEYCSITAPSEGQVVYANDRERGEPVVIEEGTLVRYHQIVARLPDINKMQVDVKVNESHINRIKSGMAARIILDADPENMLSGQVSTVAPYPFPMRWHGAPLEYGVEVQIINPPATIRPGLRAKVQIFFDAQSDVLQVPLAAVIAHRKAHYCLTRNPNGWHAQRIRVGSNNNNQVVVLDGLSEGDYVSLTPFRFIERADLPESPVDVIADDGSQERRPNRLSANDAGPSSAQGS